MTELRHGYTLADLHAMARLAVHTTRPMASDWRDRYDTAWSAIAEHLYAAEHWPPRHDLVRAGQLAVLATVREHGHHHGYYRHTTIGAQAGPASSPAFLTYWWDIAHTTPSCEPRVVERVALHQIWSLLTPRQQETIAALAVHDDYQRAAAALDMTAVTFKSHVASARRRFLAWWHQGETPSRVWGTDRRAGPRAGTRHAGGTAIASLRRRHRQPPRRPAGQSPGRTAIGAPAAPGER